MLQLNCHEFNPDSAVALDMKREAQPFRSKVDGFLPLSRHRATVLPRHVKARNNEVRKRKMTLKFTVGRLCYSRVPPHLPYPQSNCGFRAQSSPIGDCVAMSSEAIAEGS